jgi:hypothetical protein
MQRLTDEQLRGWAAFGEPPLNKVAAELLAYRAHRPRDPGPDAEEIVDAYLRENGLDDESEDGNG